MDAEVKKAFDGHIFLWQFLVAWKTDKEHNEDFITKQWSILATFSQMLGLASASGVATGQASPKPLHADADIRGTFPGPTATSGTTMHGERNATADASASLNANANAVAEVPQDMNGEH